MFEILLNAAKVAVSKETRKCANLVISALTQSPEWQRELCTIEARISCGEAERLRLLKDIVLKKLQELAYKDLSCRNFDTVFEELTRNALEYGTRKSKGFIRLVIEVSPVYISLEVYNQRAVPVDIPGWIKTAIAHLSTTKKLQRGRGLVLAYRRADSLQEINHSGVKAVIYKNAVDIRTISLEHADIVVVCSGKSNPSFSRRLRECLQKVAAENVILCLNPRELMKGETKKLIGSTGKGLVEALDSEKKGTKERHEWACSDSDIIFGALSSLGTGSEERTEKGHFSARRTLKQRLNVRFICSDDDVRDLLPEDMVSNSIVQAYEQLKSLS